LKIIPKFYSFKCCHILAPAQTVFLTASIYPFDVLVPLPQPKGLFMKKKFSLINVSILLLVLQTRCNNDGTVPSKVAIQELGLKRGNVIVCGPATQQLGDVAFPITGSKEANEKFNLGVKLLHSFEYDEAEKVFASVIERYPECAMAYWGVAMSNFHPLWTPPAQAELQKGSKAIALAKSISKTTKREQAYIEALATFYGDWDKKDHLSRSLLFEKAMGRVHASYPADKEAASLYALALTAAADPKDKTLKKQKEAGTILNALYPNEPNHPGIVHYLIHTYDSPELAHLALPAARKYASLAPSSAHALHMPSHIFTRLGLWKEGIETNLASVSSAQCYASEAGIKGHWDEELHGMDYLVYGYLQTGQNQEAKKQWNYLAAITEVQPANFKVAYAFASIPSRYVLENRLWKEAAALPDYHANFSWDKFPWQRAILHFARAMGSVHTGDLPIAKREIAELARLQRLLAAQKDEYKAAQVQVQVHAGQAWLKWKEGNEEEALTEMKAAVALEDKTEKHPVTAGEVLPARELLGDMLLQLGRFDEALQAYKLNLQRHPNRFNGLYGAGLAAERSGNNTAATNYYRQLAQQVDVQKKERPELARIANYIQQNESAVKQVSN
jgi:tetratricopeptide (TPR) repeat protein